MAVWNECEPISNAYRNCRTFDRKGGYFLVDSVSHSGYCHSGDWNLYWLDPADISSFPHKYLGQRSWYGNRKVTPPTAWANRVIGIWERFGFSVASRDTFRFAGRILDTGAYRHLIQMLAEENYDLSRELEPVTMEITDICVIYRRNMGKKDVEPDVIRLEELLKEYDRLHVKLMGIVPIEQQLNWSMQPSLSIHR